MALDALGGSTALPRVPVARPLLEAEGPAAGPIEAMPGDELAPRSGRAKIDYDELPDFDLLSQEAVVERPQDRQEEAAPANLAPELRTARFDPRATLGGDCSVQAYMDHCPEAGDLVEQVRQGLMSSSEPFTVKVCSANANPGTRDREVQVDPQVYRALQTPAPDGPGLTPEQAFTAVTRLAIAQAIDPEAYVSWEADASGQASLVLRGSKTYDGQGEVQAPFGLAAHLVRDFCHNAQIPILGFSEIAHAMGSTWAGSGQTNGKTFVAFLSDPKTGTSHPTPVTMITRPNGAYGQETVFQVPGRGVLTREEMSHEINNYFNGVVAPNPGMLTSGGKTPKRWP